MKKAVKVSAVVKTVASEELEEQIAQDLKQEDKPLKEITENGRASGIFIRRTN